MVLKNLIWTFKTATRGVEVTRLYPEFMMDLPDNERGIHELDATTCIGCGSCARICPNSCIDMVPYKYGNPLKNKKMLFPSVDYGRCMFCGLCVDECPVSCLKMGKHTEIAGWNRQDIIYGPDKITVKSFSEKEAADLAVEAKRIAAEKKKAAAEAAKAKAAKAKAAGEGKAAEGKANAGKNDAGGKKAGKGGEA